MIEIDIEYIDNQTEKDFLSNNSIELILNNICEKLNIINNKMIILSVAIVSKKYIQDINLQYRKINKSTNILSFPFEKVTGMPEDDSVLFLGDIVVCPDILKSEAIHQKKTFENHTKHIVIHGILHLLGYDHITKTDAENMENLEIILLNQLSIKNPYEC